MIITTRPKKFTIVMLTVTGSRGLIVFVLASIVRADNLTVMNNHLHLGES